MRYKKNSYGSYILTNKDGNEFTVTQKEYKELQTLVKRANQRRVDKAHRYYDTLVDSNMMVGKDYDSYMEVLREKGFITEKYSTSLQQFKSKEDVTELLKELRAVTKKGYGNNRVDDIRYKMIEQINEEYGLVGSSLAHRIEKMSDGELLGIYLLADKDIVGSLFYLSTGVEPIDQVNKSNTYIDTLLEGSVASKKDMKEFKKGFKNYKARQKRKRQKRGW